MSDSGSEDIDGGFNPRKALCAPVLARINLERLLSFASSIRRQHQPSANPHSADTETSKLACTVLPTPVFESFHTVFFLQFDDDTRWILKVPAKGVPEKWTVMAGRRLTAEAMTMRLLRRETTIPIPEIYAFDATFNNELNCPFILMEYINGIPLQTGWFKGKASKDSVDRFRARALQDLSHAMVQLRKFVYNKGGFLLFDREGNVSGVGPVITVDQSSNFDTTSISNVEETSVCEVGPFANSQAYVFRHLWEKEDPRTKWDLGILRMLRVLVTWLPWDAWKENQEFVLTHPNLSHQNVIVSAEGALLGLIDWDGVAAVPRCVGCEAYPSWLTRDCDPTMYNYDHQTGDLIIPTGSPEDSPEELMFYRDMYARLIYARLSEQVKRSNTSRTGLNTSSRPQRGYDVTRNSLLLDSLVIAANKPMCAAGILEHIFDEIARITADDWCGTTPMIELENSSTENMDCDQPRMDDAQSMSDYSEPSDEEADEDVIVKETSKDDYKNDQMCVEYNSRDQQDEQHDEAVANSVNKDNPNPARDGSSSSERSPSVDESESGSEIRDFTFSDAVYACADQDIEGGMFQRLLEGFEAMLY